MDISICKMCLLMLEWVSYLDSSLACSKPYEGLKHARFGPKVIPLVSKFPVIIFVFRFIRHASKRHKYGYLPRMLITKVGRDEVCLSGRPDKLKVHRNALSISYGVQQRSAYVRYAVNWFVHLKEDASSYQMTMPYSHHQLFLQKYLYNSYNYFD